MADATTTPAHPTIRLPVDRERIAAFSRKWHVLELALFGSVLRDDFGPDSDVDVLVTFEANAPVSLWDWGPMMDELQSIFGRRVDLVERPAIKNPLRRQSILSHYEILYAA